MSLEAATVSQLIDLAVAVKSTAYCPYSDFHVGASILGDNGKIYTGINVENSSYPTGCCAEITASVKAVSDGCRAFSIIVVAADSDDFIWPCGKCRQFINEFKTVNTKVIVVNKDLKTESKTFEDLLPFGFKLKHRTPEVIE